MIAVPMSRALSSPLASALARSGVSGFPSPPAPDSNVIIRSLVERGLVDGLRLPDEMRTGTVRPLQPGRCVTLNGSTQYVAKQSGASVPSAFPFTLSGWFYSTASGFQVICGLCNDAASNEYFHVAYDGSASQVTALRRTSSGETFANFGTSIATNTWYHVAVCFLSDTSCKWSINGSDWVTITGLASRPLPTLNTYLVGNVRITGGASYLFTGRLFDCRCWSDELTQAELDTVYAHGSHTGNLVAHYKLDQPNSALQQDSSGNGNHGTIAAWATGVHYEGSDVPYSWQNEVGYSGYTNGVGTNLVADANATLSTSDYTATANQEYAPATGTLVADKYLETAATVVRHIGLSDAVTIPNTDGTTPYVASFDVKPIGRTNVQVWLYNTGLTKHTRWAFTLSGDGTVSGPAHLTWQHCGNRITNLGGGWYRCEIGFVPDAGNTSVKFALYGENATSYAGDTAKGYYLANRVIKKGAIHTPRDESDPTLDVPGNSLEFSGRCPLEPPLGNSNALTLNGSNQYVTVGTGTWDTDGTQAMDISFWFKTTGTSDFILSAMENSGNYRGWGVYTSAGGALYIDITNVVSTNQLLVGTTTAFNDGTWHKARFTYDGTKAAAGVAIYVDDIRQATTTASNNLTGTVSTAATVSYVGTRGGSLLYNGSICGITVTIGSTTWRIPCSEGGEAKVVHETRTKTAYPIANAGSNWSVLQPEFHESMSRGHRYGANLLPYSEQFDNALWNKTQTTVTANSTTAPDGTATADTLSNAAAGGTAFHYTYYTLTLTQNETYTITVYAKAKTGSGIFWILGETSSNAFCYFNVGTGAVGTTTGFTASIESVGSGWYRCRATFTKTSATASEQVGFGVTPANGTPDWNSTGLADTQQIYIWGAQLEVGSTASTYFKTVEANGLARIPAEHGSSTVSANNLTLTHPAGNKNPLAESEIDFTCGEPDAPVFAGQTIGDIDDYVAGRVVALLQKQSTTYAESRYQLLKP